MNTISILKRGPISRNGVYDATVTINGKDCGVLYLKETEKDILLGLIQSGKFESETEFNTDLYPENDLDGDI